MAGAGQSAEVSAPLLVVASNNKGGFVAVITALTMCFVLVAFGIRTYVRMVISGFRLDDFVLAIASVVSCLQSSVVFLQVSKGFGKSSELLDRSQIVSIEKTVYAGDILYIFTLYLSKLCVGFLYLRLTPDRSHSRAAWATMAASTLWAVISIFVISLRCNLSHPWTDIDDGQCSGFFARWQFVGALDVITELGLFSMSVYLVYGLQMSMKSKAIVVGAFAFRLPVICAAALHLHYLQLQTHSANPFLAGAYTAVCAQFELGYGLMASSMPCLKPFMSAYEGPLHPPHKSNAHYSSSGDYKLTTYSSSSAASHQRKKSKNNNNNNNNNNSSSSKSSDRRQGAASADQPDRRLRSDQPFYKATISHPDKSRRSASIGSADSRQRIIQKEDMVIKKEVKWSVEREGADDFSEHRTRSDLDVIGRAPELPNP